MKKRIAAALLFLVALLSLCACQSDSAKSGGETANLPQTAVEIVSEPTESEQNVETDIPGDRDIVHTDPTPVEKPQPTQAKEEPKKEKINTCTISIECSSVFRNLKKLDSDKLDIIPSNGVILAPRTVSFSEGESVFDVLQRVCRENAVPMEASFTPIYNSSYVEGIHNLYELDCGSGSGWMYCVNGNYPNYGCSQYKVTCGDVIEWRYTCDLGADLGASFAGG